MDNLQTVQDHLYNTPSSIENKYANISLNNKVDDPELFSREEKDSPFSKYNPFTEQYQTNVNGGRLPDINPNLSYPQFELFQENHRGPEQNFYDSLQGIMENSIVAKVFFSKKNIDNIQRKIINGVFNRSEGKINIGRQSDTELKIVMRSIFLQKGRNVDCKVQEQIMNLNHEVLEYSIENVLVGAVGHINYIRDLQRTMDTLPNPENANIKGVNSLQPNIFF
jgi:hypothetical protein